MTVLLDVSKELIGSRIKHMAELDEMINTFESTAQFELYQEAKRKRKRLEGEVREIAVDCFEQTEAKHPHAAVSVKMRMAYEWDEEQARHYARKETIIGMHPVLMTIAQEAMPDTIRYLADVNPLFLTIDTKAFAKHVKALPALPEFVTETKEPYASIVKDLSEFVRG
jgi:hypothetical protein